MLPYIPYGDNISAYSQTGFGGINHNPSAADGELYRVKNLTSDLYPLLSSRPERVQVTTLTKANGLFAKEKLAWVDGTNFYYDNELIGQVADSPKTFASMGYFLLIFPDKKYFLTNWEEGNIYDRFGDLEASYTLSLIHIWLELGYCDNEGDVSRYQGAEYDVVGFEEATLFPEEWIVMITTSVRTTRRDWQVRFYYTCNPGGVGHAYIKRLFIDRRYKEGERPDDYRFIRATVLDNKVLMEADPGYIDRLRALPPAKRRAHLEGDWSVYEAVSYTHL